MAEIRKKKLYEVKDSNGHHHIVFVKDLNSDPTWEPELCVLFSTAFPWKVGRWRPWNLDGLLFTEISKEDLPLYVSWFITGFGEKYLKGNLNASVL